MADLAMRFFVNGTPKGQPRPRAFSRGGSARVYDPATAEGWKGAIALSVVRELDEPLEGPIFLSVIYYMPRPKRLYRKKDYDGCIRHTAKPDIDNLNKAVMDALTQIGIWKDDSQVAKLEAEKWYHEKSASPGAAITIKTL